MAGAREADLLEAAARVGRHGVEIHHHPEADQLVEGGRGIEIGAVEVDVEDGGGVRARGVVGHRNLVIRPAGNAGRRADAERAIATARGLLGDEPLLDANEALLWAKRGDEPKALAALARMAQDRRSFAHTHHAQHHAAAAYALLERREEAIELLRRASGCGLPNHPLFAGDPHLASLRDEPAMQQLMAELAEGDAGFRAEFGSG